MRLSSKNCPLRNHGLEWAVAKIKYLEVEGRALPVSNLEKVYYPETGFTLGEMLDYFLRIAPSVLPHLREQPLRTFR